MGETMKRVADFLLDKRTEQQLFDPDFNRDKKKPLTPQEELRKKIRQNINKTPTAEDLEKNKAA